MKMFMGWIAAYKEFLRGLFKGVIVKDKYTICLEGKSSSGYNIDIMKVPGIWVFFFVVGTALLVFTVSSSSSIPGKCFNLFSFTSINWSR